MDADRETRLNAVNYARASIGLEGITPSLQDEEYAAAYIDGHITLDEFLQRLTETDPYPGRSSPSAT